MRIKGSHGETWELNDGRLWLIQFSPPDKRGRVKESRMNFGLCANIEQAIRRIASIDKTTPEEIAKLNDLSVL